MKRYILNLLILILIIIFGGCSLKGDSLSDKQRKAVKNCIVYMETSLVDTERINKDIVEVRNATENTWKSVFQDGKKIDQNAIDLTDWIFTIGDTSTAGHDFMAIVCDSDTCEVIGVLPID